MRYGSMQGFWILTKAHDWRASIITDRHYESNLVCHLTVLLTTQRRSPPSQGSTLPLEQDNNLLTILPRQRDLHL